LRTADATSPVIGESIFVTLVLFVLAYGAVFSFGIYYINRLINRGPEAVAEEVGGYTRNPISAAHEAGRHAVQPR
jgi:cytochrome bd ubiquinol oxidase subunit I